MHLLGTRLPSHEASDVPQVIVCTGTSDRLLGCGVLEGSADAASIRDCAAAARTVADGSSSQTWQQEQSASAAPGTATCERVSVDRAANGPCSQPASGPAARRTAPGKPTLLTHWLRPAASPAPSTAEQQLGRRSDCKRAAMASTTSCTAAPTGHRDAVLCGLRVLWVVTDQRREAVTACLRDAARRIGVIRQQ